MNNIEKLIEPLIKDVEIRGDREIRMANVIEKQYQAIESLRNRLSIYDCQEQVDDADTLAHLQQAYIDACEALIVIDKIAGGEGV